MQKVKEFFKSKEMRRVVMMCMAMCVMAISCFAADGDASSTATITSAFQSGFSSFTSDALSMLGIAITAAIPLAGAIWLARKAMSWFKGVAK